MRISDGRKRAIYESCFSPDRVYTIEEAYAFIEENAPDLRDDREEPLSAAEVETQVRAVKEFLRKLDARFPRVSLREAAGLD
jgi:hypothetical protein